MNGVEVPSIQGVTAPTNAGEVPVPERPDLIEWLRTGQLTLVDHTKNPIQADGWSILPPEVRANALADFDRLIRSNTKAAVIFLRA